MICHIALGVFGGLAAVKVLRHWRRGGGCHHHSMDGGLHGFGGRGRRFGRGGRRMAWWLGRKLELNDRQQQELVEILAELKETIGAHRIEHLDDLAHVADAFGDETLDRAKIDAAIDARGAKFAEIKKSVADAVEHLHNILTPEQRQRLRQLISSRMQ